MNRQEHLLTCLSEECSEVSQAIGKALRFGLADGYPSTNRTNQNDILDEINDVFAIMELLSEDGSIDRLFINRQKIDAKKEKVKKMMQYAIDRGTLQVGT